MIRSVPFTLALGLALLPAALARAEDQPAPIEVHIKDHRFTPAEIHVAAGGPVLLVVRNDDDSPEEMESTPLQIEKVMPGGAQSRVRLRPLAAGRYPFFGEYHPDTAQGAIVAE